MTINLYSLGDVPEGGEDDELEAAVLALVGAAFGVVCDPRSTFGTLAALGFLRDRLNYGLPGGLDPLPKTAELLDRVVDLVTLADHKLNGEPDDD